MSNNREKRVYLDNVDILMGIQRTSKNADNRNCIRQIVYEEELDLKILEGKLSAFGGEWRIYKTVNKRCVEKASKYLQHKLIDHPEAFKVLESEWRTALLQVGSIYGKRKFMLDIDTEDKDKIALIETIISEEVKKIAGDNNVNNVDFILNRIKSPKGWHYITNKFDTRRLLKECGEYVTLLRDGYHYVKTVNNPLTSE